MLVQARTIFKTIKKTILVQARIIIHFSIKYRLTKRIAALLIKVLKTKTITTALIKTASTIHNLKMI